MPDPCVRSALREPTLNVQPHSSRASGAAFCPEARPCGSDRPPIAPKKPLTPTFDVQALMGASCFCEFMTLLVDAAPLLNAADTPTLVRISPTLAYEYSGHGINN